uniref:isoleucine--tRNA ligase n=1 Tax=Oryza barthii TaxID=65489 RepID=A0A0D3F1M9_9ORYZ
MDEVCEGKDFSFPAEEERVLRLWEELDAFHEQLRRTAGGEEFVFYDGPPFATGLPHYGHLLAGTIKDAVARHHAMRGRHVARRFGWDCHGVPVERAVDEALRIATRAQVLEMGVASYNDACRGVVTRYVAEWEAVVTRMGRWVDFEDGYKTMDIKFMESVWWVFAQLWDKDLVYKSFKVMPYSTGMKTPLSNFEAGQHRQFVPAETAMVSFPVVGDVDNAALVAWTTTPWTLPSNLALCVNAKFVYAKVKDKSNGSVYIVAETRLDQLLVTVKVTGKKPGPSKGSSGAAKNGLDTESYELLEKIHGSSLVGLRYTPLFDYFSELQDTAFRVVADNCVADDTGTGVVHFAPAFGEDDYRVCLASGIVEARTLAFTSTRWAGRLGHFSSASQRAVPVAYSSLSARGYQSMLITFNADAISTALISQAISEKLCIPPAEFRVEILPKMTNDNVGAESRVEVLPKMTNDNVGVLNKVVLGCHLPDGQEVPSSPPEGDLEKLTAAPLPSVVSPLSPSAPNTAVALTVSTSHGSVPSSLNEGHGVSSKIAAPKEKHVTPTMDPPSRCEHLPLEVAPSNLVTDKAELLEITKAPAVKNRLAKRVRQKIITATSRRSVPLPSNMKKRRLLIDQMKTYVLMKKLGIITKDEEVDEDAMDRCIAFLKEAYPGHYVQLAVLGVLGVLGALVFAGGVGEFWGRDVWVGGEVFIVVPNNNHHGFKSLATGTDLVVAVDDDGFFKDKISEFNGLLVTDKETNKYVINAVKCRFIRVERIRDQLLECNKETYWVPDYVKEKRFHNWLEGARDWAVSRTRFWGTPLPLWISQDGEEIIVMDSVDKLEKLSGVKISDLHRHHIDGITVPSQRGEEFGALKRVDEVFDCWFESGSMPYAYIHYPFENRELFEKNFPGDFIAEGLDQTRGWFYTLMVLSTALFGKPAFKNLICNGLVLAEDGKKMSKSKNNYPSPMEVIDNYGADALRLYVINSPVVRAESLRFNKNGVHGVVKDVFLPWYNAYRFLVQNAKRLEVEGLAVFSPINQAILLRSSNVLDHWIQSATESLVSFVREEMDAYRLYTVVPYLVKYIDNLTNIYVRFNRKRLKGRTGEDDCRISLSTLYHALVTTCVVMAPFTPFFTEVLYQNLRKVSSKSEKSIHFCNFPSSTGQIDERVEHSVNRMMTIVDLARNIRERHNRPLKTPLRHAHYTTILFTQFLVLWEMVVVHPDNDFLEDITGKLKEYVKEEMNVKMVTACSDPLVYSSLRAEPNFSVLGKRLGKDMGKISNEVKKMTQDQILTFEESGEIFFGSHLLTLEDIKVFREFKRPANVSEKEIDAAGDGDVLVILDLQVDQSLFEAGVAREVVNKIQKLKKTAQLRLTDPVDVYYSSQDSSDSSLEKILQSQDQYIRDALGSPLTSKAQAQPNVEVICEEAYNCVSHYHTFRLLQETVKLVHPFIKIEDFP